MLDFAWSEMAVIAVVALIVLGPKELPQLLRVAGQWIAKARTLARDFQAQVDDMVRQAELDEIKKQVDNVGQQIEAVARTDVAAEIEKTVDPKGDVAEQLKLPDLSQIPAVDPGPVAAAEPAQPAPAAPVPEIPVQDPVVPATTPAVPVPTIEPAKTGTA
ncbi:MAG: twin-arginine translocase subunit TatB [Alphaproteobacteria bacterium]|nr:twin-arginine translocase subunit TatB [Alphaproteobacteria bacterium]